MELHTAAHPPPSPPASTRRPPPSPRRARPRPISPRRHLRRVIVAACLLALTPALVSYTVTMLEPSNSSLGIRSVEWLRDHGAAGLVTTVESVYYSLTAPSKGGPALKALPRVGVASSGGASSAVELGERPARIRPLSRPALPGEGVWRPTQVGGSRSDPPLLVSTFRSDPSEYPRLVAGVAWINTKRTTVSLYAGRLEPAVELPTRGAMEVPTGYRR